MVLAIDPASEILELTGEWQPGAMVVGTVFVTKVMAEPAGATELSAWPNKRPSLPHDTTRLRPASHGTIPPLLKILDVIV